MDRDDHVVATSALAALVDELAAPEATRRRAAAKSLLDKAAEDVVPAVLAWPIPALEKAIDDPDEETRRTAALALIVRSWLSGPLTRVVPYLDEAYLSPDPHVREVAHAAALAAARTHGDVKKGAQLVLPVMDQALKQGSTELKRDVLLTLERLQRLGADLAPLVPTLNELLGHSDPGVVSYALGVLRPLAGRLEGVEHFAPLLARPDKNVQLGVAQIMAIAYLQSGDAAGLSALMAHSSPFVREGAAGAALTTVSLGQKIDAAVAALGAGLADAAGAVVFKSAKALENAALAGADVGAAVPALETATGRVSYPAEGWSVGPLDLAAQSDLRQESPARDAAAALTAHALNRGEVATVEALLARPLPAPAVEGAIRVLESVIEVPRWAPLLDRVNPLLERLEEEANAAPPDPPASPAGDEDDAL